MIIFKKHHKNLLHSQKGFSLAEVMIAAGMMGIVSLGVMKLSKNQIDNSKRVESRYDETTALSEIRVMLSDPAACKNSFLNQKHDGTVALPAYLKDKNDNSKYLTGSTNKLGTSRIYIKGYSFTDYNASEETVQLNVAFVRGKSINKNITSILKKIAIQVKLYDSNNDSALEIETCVSASRGDLSPWKQQPGGDLYYSGGNVGIGTTSPDVKLRIESSQTRAMKVLGTANGPSGLLHIGNSNAANNWNLGVETGTGWASGASGTFYIDKDGVGPKLAIAPNGNVGIGTVAPTEKLEIVGNLKVSGTITSNNQMQVVTGSINDAEDITTKVPTGYTNADCKWLLSLRDLQGRAYNGDYEQAEDQFQVMFDANGTSVIARARTYNFKQYQYGAWRGGSANYMGVCSK